MPTVKGYRCLLLGADINDTVTYDCSSSFVKCYI